MIPSCTPSIDICLDLSPYQKFMYALNAPESKRQYPKRLQIFFNYLQIKGLTIEEKTNSFYTLIKDHGGNWLETELLKFFYAAKSKG